MSIMSIISIMSIMSIISIMSIFVYIILLKRSPQYFHVLFCCLLLKTYCEINIKYTNCTGKYELASDIF